MAIETEERYQEVLDCAKRCGLKTEYLPQTLKDWKQWFVDNDKLYKRLIGGKK